MTGTDVTGPDGAGAPLDGDADAGAAAERLAVAFARVLRGGGLSVPLGSVLTFGEALGDLGLEDRNAVYWAARTTLVRRPEDIPFFDRAFAVFWEQRAPGAEPAPDEVLHLTLAVDTDEGDDQQGEAEPAGDDPTLTLRFSATETLRQKDFAAYSRDELRQAQQLMADLRLAGSPRRSRRLVKSKIGRRSGQARPDLRRTVHAALRAGGEPISQRYREPGERLRRLVLLLDVSGSMEPYARALLRFVQAAVAGRQRVEAFALGTRLTRVHVRAQLPGPRPRAGPGAGHVQDWSGGTRLGECLRQFNDRWGVRGMARGAIVVILSDGWDRGEPEVLAEQMVRLQRVAYKVVWVNPLKVTPGYAPLARGMAAALPHVDDFVEGHSVVALEELAEVISR